MSLFSDNSSSRLLVQLRERSDVALSTFMATKKFDAMLSTSRLLHCDRSISASLLRCRRRVFSCEQLLIKKFDSLFLAAFIRVNCGQLSTLNSVMWLSAMFIRLRVFSEVIFSFPANPFLCQSISVIFPFSSVMPGHEAGSARFVIPSAAAFDGCLCAGWFRNDLSAATALFGVLAMFVLIPNISHVAINSILFICVLRLSVKCKFSTPMLEYLFKNVQKRVLNVGRISLLVKYS